LQFAQRIRHNIKIVDFYILNEVLRAFAYVFCLFLSLCFIVVLFEELDTILASDSSFTIKIVYVLLNVPHMVVKAAPIIVVISIVTAIGNMLRHNEVLMLYIAGYSPLRIGSPIAISLTILIVMLFVINETISGPFASQAHLIKETQIKANSSGLVGDGGIWMHGQEDQIYKAGNYIPHTRTIENLEIFEFQGPNRTLSRRLFADSSTYNPQNGMWTLLGVVDHHIHTDGSITRDWLDEHEYYMDAAPEDFKTITMDPEQMSYSDLSKVVYDIQRAGESPGEFLTHMRIKEAFPFAVFFLGIMSFGVILRYGMVSRASGIGLGVLAAIGYFLILSLGKSFAESGMFPAWIGAWTPNAICFILTIYLFTKIYEEV